MPVSCDGCGGSAGNPTDHNNSHQGGAQDAHASHARVSATHHAEGLPAPAAVDRAVLSDGVHRSHQRLLRGAHHEPGPGPDAPTGTAWAPASSSSATRCSKCPATWCCTAPAHALWIARIMITWGIISGLDGRRHRAHQLPGAALPARRGGGRILPRHHLLSHLLVSRRVPGPRHLDPVHRRTGFECNRVGPLRRDPGDGRHARTQGLAMGVHHRGDPRGAARLRRAVADDRATGPRDLARAAGSANGWRPSWRPSAAASRAPAASPCCKR